MERGIYLMRIGAILLLCCCSGAAFAASGDQKNLYIVYMGSNKHLDAETTIAKHHDILSSVLGSTSAVQDSIVYSYKHSFSGFSAMLSPEEYIVIAGMPGVLSAFPSQSYKLHTTRSWEFLGLSPTEGVWPSSKFGSEVIVGTIDSGVWPEAQSFRDDGSLGPIPERWKGVCEAGEKFTAADCNRKLIGARYFVKGYEAIWGPVSLNAGDIRSARDSDGHGTHTTSTLAGSLVRNANLKGLARGDARGGAPNARIASYKVCWTMSCTDADILAAFDEAVHDGVDVLSISLGGVTTDYFNDAMAVGSFHATERGIVVACSAGNDGPDRGTVNNVAPWIITVAASTIDRQFSTGIHLDNNITYTGQSINTIKLHRRSYPLVYAGDIPAKNASSYNTSFCYNGTLDSAKVKGRIVLCQLGQGSVQTVEEAGGKGTILIAEAIKTFAFVFGRPAAVVSYGVGSDIQAYINSTRHPVALISPTTTKTGGPAPLAATFSSRGPNVLTPDIFKPDVTAPGVDILAAWSPVSPPSGDLFDKRSFKYNIISGTSMSCPHVAGAAALVKAMHPHWSPSSIKSALMTTATPLDATNEQNADGNLAWGSGQINPTAAMDPGLLYDASTADYVHFLCSLGYNETLVEAVTNSKDICPKSVPSVNNLNYPSITATDLSQTFHVVRTVTNVGNPNSVYNVSVHHPSGVKVTVEPSTLTFEDYNQRLAYTVTLTLMIHSEPVNKKVWVFGELVWKDGVHAVRSPIAVLGPKVLV